MTRALLSLYRLISASALPRRCKYPGLCVRGVCVAEKAGVISRGGVSLTGRGPMRQEKPTRFE